MEILSRILQSHRQRHRHLQRLSDRVMLCTLPADSSPKETQRLIEAVRANYELTRVMAIQVNGAMPLPIPNCIQATCEAMTLDSIITICRPVRSWLQSSPDTVALIQVTSDDLPVLAACILLECDPSRDSYASIIRIFVQLCARCREKGLAAGKNPLASEERFLQYFAAIHKKLDVVGSLLLTSPVIVHSLTFLSIPRYGRVIPPKGQAPSIPYEDRSTVRLFFMVLQRSEVVFNSLMTEGGPRFLLSGDKNVTFNMRSIQLVGDLTFRIYHRRTVGAPKLMFSLYLHSAFFDPSQSTLTIPRYLIDKACIDQRYDDAFGLEFSYTPGEHPPSPSTSRRLPLTTTTTTTATSPRTPSSLSSPSSPSSSSSSSSTRSSSAAPAAPARAAPARAAPGTSTTTSTTAAATNHTRRRASVPNALSAPIAIPIGRNAEGTRTAFSLEDNELSSWALDEGWNAEYFGSGGDTNGHATNEEHHSDAEDDQILSDYAFARRLQDEFYAEATREIRAPSVSLKGEILNGKTFDTSHISLLPIAKYHLSLAEMTNGAHECQICRMEYEVEQEVRTLPCFHIFHVECIDRWLLQKPHCPVCLTKIAVICQQIPLD